MFKNIRKKSAVLIAVLLLASQTSLVAIPVLGAGEATLSLGSATLRNGCPGSIPINIDTGGEKVLAADVILTVGGDATVDSLALGSALPMQACNDPSVPEIMLCGARQPGTGGFDGTAVYGTINVTPGSTGTLNFNFDGEASNVINDSIQDVLGDTTGNSYTVLERYNVAVNGTGFCNPDTTAPVITVSPYNGQNNVPVDTSITLTLSDDRVGVDVSTLTFSVNGIKVDTFSYTATGGTYKPVTPFELGERVEVVARVCDKEKNCRDYNGSFRTTPPAPPPDCGDGNLNEGEDCDDGRQTAACDRDCTFVECGDGVINDMAGEQCDDFNEDDGDGCSSICTVEAPVEDATYCPVLKSAAPVCPVPEAQPIIPTEGEEPLPEEDFEEEDFAEAASVSVEAAELRPAAKTILLPTGEKKKEEIDPCILQYGTAGATLDHDEDGLSDRTECYAGTDPNKQDTDGDTCFDGEEINRFYTDPLVKDCSISDYVEEEVLIIDPKPNWILTRLEISGSAPRRSLTVGVTAFPAIQKTFSKARAQYSEFLDVLKRDVDPLNTVAVQQKISDTTEAITKLQAAIADTQAFIEKYSANYVEIAAELERVTAFLDSGTAAVSKELEQAESLYEALEKLKTKSAFLGEVNRLQTVGVGNTTTTGFNLTPDVELKDGIYDLVATAGFEDGGTKSSAPVRIQLSSTIDVGTPLPQTLDGIPIGAEMITTENQRPVLSGKSVYGAMVFATWESLVLESSIIADSAEGIFDVQPPRNLEAGQEHKVTLYAVTETEGGFVRSANTTVDFVVAETARSTIYYYIVATAALGLMLTVVSNMIKNRRKKQQKSN